MYDGLTNEWHPTQMLADMLTMRDHVHKPLAEVTYCYLGDGLGRPPHGDRRPRGRGGRGRLPVHRCVAVHG
jgi:hypothetical protein